MSATEPDARALARAQAANGLEDPPLCSCRKGYLMPRNGAYGRFYGCSTYPRCVLTCTQIEAAQAYDGDGGYGDGG